MNVSVGSCCPELAQAHSSVALVWHKARGSTPFGVTSKTHANWPHGELATHCADHVNNTVLQQANDPRRHNFSHKSRSTLRLALHSRICRYRASCIRQREVAISLSICKLTWLVLGKDPAACSCRAEQFIAR